MGIKADKPLHEPFISRVIQGKARIEQVDDEVDAWHSAKNLPKSETLARWLGFSEEEYARFVTDPKELDRVVALREGARND